MPVSGIIANLSPNPEHRRHTLELLGSTPRVTLGDAIDGCLPLVIEADTMDEHDVTWSEIAALDGVRDLEGLLHRLGEEDREALVLALAAPESVLAVLARPAHAHTPHRAHGAQLHRARLAPLARLGSLRLLGEEQVEATAHPKILRLAGREAAWLGCYHHQVTILDGDL